MRGSFDLLYLMLFAYPLAVLVGFWLSPDVIGVLLLAGTVIAVPLFLLHGRGEQRIEGRGFPWFQMVLVGVSFAWPFIIVMLVSWLLGHRHREGPPARDERDRSARE